MDAYFGGNKKIPQHLRKHNVKKENKNKKAEQEKDDEFMKELFSKPNLKQSSVMFDGRKIARLAGKKYQYSVQQQQLRENMNIPALDRDCSLNASQETAATTSASINDDSPIPRKIKKLNNTEKCAASPSSKKKASKTS